MVNVGLSWSSVVGIALAIAGAALYFLRSFRPGLARDHDIFFAAVSLLCGGILFFQGWRQDPILQFGQFLLAGSAIFFAFESIRLRSVATEQAKRSTPIVDDERPISRVYRAELDDYNALEEQRSANPRRIRGSRDGRSSQIDEYGDEVRRRSSGSRNGSSRHSSDTPAGDLRGDRPARKRRPTSSDSRPPRDEDRFFDADTRSVWDDTDTPSSRSRDDASRPRSSDFTASRPKRPRPPQSSQPSRRDERAEPPASNYVPYQPIDDSDDEINRSPKFE
jgi:hypothetical protein